MTGVQTCALPIYQFRDVLTKAGYVTITRKPRGDDIDAACGQLAGKVLDKTKRRLSQVSYVQQSSVQKMGVHGNKSCNA